MPSIIMYPNMHTMQLLISYYGCTLIARSQCSLAVVSCSMCLSTSATDKLQLLFFRPQTTFSSPVSTLCNSEFKSLQLSVEQKEHVRPAVGV